MFFSNSSTFISFETTHKIICGKRNFIRGCLKFPSSCWTPMTRSTRSNPFPKLRKELLKEMRKLYLSLSNVAQLVWIWLNKYGMIFFVNVTLFQVSVCTVWFMCSGLFTFSLCSYPLYSKRRDWFMPFGITPLDAVALYSVCMVQYFKTSRYVPILGRPSSGWPSTCLRVWSLYNLWDRSGCRFVCDSR